MSWLWAAAAQDAFGASREVTNNVSIFSVKCLFHLKANNESIFLFISFGE